MGTRLNITVTNLQRGTTNIVPYSHTTGLQHVVVGGKPTPALVIYEVPYYEVRIDGGGTYDAVRFGLTNDGKDVPSRGCDAGLSQARTCTPSWIPTYSPHSFNGVSRPGAWQLLPGRGFLIHEGADTRVGQVGGSLGCIEILDGKWNRFLVELEKLAGTTCAAIGKSGALTVSIQSASYPTATRV